MPNNPDRDSRGGDVSGTTKIAVSQGAAIDVSKASFDPGYPIENTLKAGGINRADLTRGFCDSEGDS